MQSQVSNNKYEKEWERVSKLESESLPQSALEAVNEIFQKAVDEKNTTQIIKAIIYSNKNEVTIDAAKSGNIFSDFESLLTEVNDASEKALLHSMLAELYLSYYQNDRWTINQRTNLSDIVPSDMKEWTTSIFKDKIIEHLNVSINAIEHLKKQTTKDFDDIILLGTVGQKYYPTLYDFLMVRAIDVSKELIRMGNREFDLSDLGYTAEQLSVPAEEYVKLSLKGKEDNSYAAFFYFQQYLKDLLSRNLLPTIILTDIDKVDFLSQRSNSLSEDKLTQAYVNLYNEYEKEETAVEIIAKIVDPYKYNRGEINKNKYDWLKKGIEQYPDYYAIDILKDKLNELEYPTINIRGSELFYPGEKAKIKIWHKNIQALKENPQFKLYQFKDGEYYAIKDYSLKLHSKTTYGAETLSLDLGILPVGKYVFSDLSAERLANRDKIYNSDSQNRFDFVVSSLMSFAWNNVKDGYEIFVVDRSSGKPLKDVTVKVYSNVYNKPEELLSTLKTDELGRAVYTDTRTTDNNGIAYKMKLGADSCLNKMTVHNQNYKWNVDNRASSDVLPVTTVLADRAIYRPGQTVYFKAITIDKDSKVVPNKNVTAKLFNANREIIDEKELRTNEFGSVFDSFILPQSGLLGSYSIEVDQGSVYFKVEEYKRPTFEVTFDKVEKTYTFGEEVTIKGYAKNFSGVNLQDAEVKYSITREQFSFWPWRSGSESKFDNGTVKTNDDGSFEISFVPQAGDGNRSLLRINNKDVYTFAITATVTDINGETQSNTFSLVVGNVSMVINLDMPDKIEKNSDYKINIKAHNLQAQEIETVGTYIVHRLNDEDSIQSKVFEGSFKTGLQQELKDNIKLFPSGKYRLQIKALDDKKNEIEESKDFILYSYKDKRPPIKTHEWLIKKNAIFGEKPVEIIYGTTDKDVYVLYQLLNNNKVFERRFVKLDNSNHTFSIPYKEEYGEEVVMSLVSVRDGIFHDQSIRLKKEEKAADTKLNIKLEVFRDKLRPGQEETWTISVKDTTDTPAVAELLASMYDTSLDKLFPYYPWSINYPQKYRPYIYSPNYTSNWFNNGGNSFFYLDFEPEKLRNLDRTLDALNWFGYFRYSIFENKVNFSLSDTANDELVVVGYGTQRKKTLTGAVSIVDPSALRSYPSNMSGVLAGEVDGVVPDESYRIVLSEESMNMDELAPQLRQNFAETAFFYPSLRINEKGETQLTFTVPESNTTWRFRALAHDKNGRVGTLEQMVMTRKELMVTPNMPRFVRQGDKTSISTKISNLSESTISGDVRIEFFDPLTYKVIKLSIENQTQSFSIEKDASTSASWTFSVPADIELIGCRIVAQNETFSDGEQHVLAVLSNRMLVTESLPIDITKSGTSTFIFDKLYNNKSQSLDNYKLTLEYTSNPVWYAVQALPTMSNPSNENAVNWFASYYVNTLGTSIVRQYPKVAAMIQAWKSQGGNEQTLVSKLQKDEELKAVLLEETPWVLDAKTETEQMERLSLLFDLNNSKQMTSAATAKLMDLQTESGGWSWYKGFYPSRSITQYILYGYATLQEVGKVEYPEEIKRMQMDALKFIDKEILDDFNRLKKNNKDWEKLTSVSTNQLEFAYVRSFYRDIPIDKESREAERFYTDVASKNWTKLNMYERSILAIVLKRNGEDTLANKIVKSIKEHAVKDKKLGMYWPNNRSNVFMSMSAISVHTFLMESLIENGASVAEIDAMKRWLLAQKQTQVWESTHATIDAINLLLSTGSDWFSDDSSSVVKVGGSVVEPARKELGTGYMKQTWSKSEINKELAKVEVKTSSTKPAYGALYWQYYENLDKIEAHRGELNVEKQLFKEINTDLGKSLSLVADNNILKVGDKVVVRLTVRTNQDMEFVHLKDMRASCFEPEQTLSGVRWSNNLIYYQTPKDASTNFYFDRLPKGTYVLEYSVYVNRSGEYANGITTIQCMYAPQYVSHTQGIIVTVKE